MEVLPSFSDDDYSWLLESSYYLDKNEHTNQIQAVNGESILLVKELALIEDNLVRLANDKKYKDNYLSLINLRKKKETFLHQFPINTFSPYVNLFFEAPYHPHREEESSIKFLEHLKNELAGELFKKEIQKKRKAISKNKQSLLRYIESLFEYRSRLLVLRIDFSYQKDKNEFFTTSKGKKIDLLLGAINKDLLEEWSIEVREQRNQLIKGLKKKYKKDLVGYVWKLEYGADKAFHYHMIFFLDESKYHQDIKIAESIGEMWKHEITNGKGIYWNCNAKKKHFEKSNRVATGKIKHDNQELRANLDAMASYLTKPDYFVKLTLPDGTRTFGKGGKPKKMKSGRPRK